MTNYRATTTSLNDDNLLPMIDRPRKPNWPSAAERVVTAFVWGVQEMTDPTGTRESGSVNRPAGSIPGPAERSH
jgi:hypothetical protein